MFARALVRFFRFFKVKLPPFLFLVFSCVVLYSSGVREYTWTIRFERSDFIYPLNLPDFHGFIKSRIHGHSTSNNSMGVSPSPISPINIYPYNFSILNKDKCHNISKDRKCRRLKNGELSKSCRNKVSIALVIKSALNHQSNRQVVRNTWGFEDRLIDVDIKRIFVLGSCSAESDGVKEVEEQTNSLCQDAIDKESEEHHDIIQGDFVDSYYNNTVKTMMAFKWLVSYCSQVDYVLFVDDDYFVSPKNLIKLVRQLNDDFYGGSSKTIAEEDGPSGDVENDFNSDGEIDTRVYAGYLFNSSIPRRDSLGKWYISLSQYPYSKYPPYVNAGAYLVSRNCLIEMYTASQYVQHFKFDDIYLGLIALKINLLPMHIEGFHYWKKSYDYAGAYKDVIATHGYSDPKELEEIWDIERSFSHV